MRNANACHDDDGDMNRHASSWDDRQVDALLAGRGEPADADLLAVVSALREFSSGRAPTPSPALQAVFDGTAVLPAPSAPRCALLRPRGSHRTKLRAGVLVITASLGLVTAGAAANALPRDAQRTAAAVLNTLTPFHFPAPRQIPAPPTPGTSPSTHPSTQTTDGPNPTTGPQDGGQDEGTVRGGNGRPTNPADTGARIGGNGTDTSETGGNRPDGNPTDGSGLSTDGSGNDGPTSPAGTQSLTEPGSDGTSSSRNSGGPAPASPSPGDGSDSPSGSSPAGPGPSEAP